MKVRIRFATGKLVRRRGTRNQRVALAFAALLIPASLLAWAIAIWRLAADLRFAGDFAIESGLFSHWQVWMGIALFLQSGAILLNRYGRRATT